ncbi:hypothetical protein [Rodentibacter genomosp. 2]|uniref:Uncharacterized protein n=1 Tax=Rodentibacter genomosp. 2 TaxID=1908266 RepID=A0A1V3JPV3_9PAST|nr:hypothetical protein [Rodentibacter genomosp. 2]OOF58852.1 hypothetical protein BKK55_01300 [Rodentibacter genomosp. 2]
MKLDLHHFNIYKKLYELDKQKIISPYLCEDIDNPSFLERIKSSVEFQEFGCTSNLILKDKVLIENLSMEDCYLIFTATSKLYQERVSLFYKDRWDKQLRLKDLYFLGWDIYNNQDGAIIEGIYPVSIDIDGFNKEVYFNNQCDMNQFGLIPTEALRDWYLEKNKKEVKIIVNGKGVKTNWEAVAIYCDKYTFKKLNKLF